MDKQNKYQKDGDRYVAEYVEIKRQQEEVELMAELFNNPAYNDGDWVDWLDFDVANRN